MGLLWAVDPHSDPQEAQMTGKNRNFYLLIIAFINISILGNGIVNNLHGTIEAEEVAEEATAAVVASIAVMTAEVSEASMIGITTEEVLETAVEDSAIMADLAIVIVTVTTVTEEIVVENEIAVGIGIVDLPNVKGDPGGVAKQSLENRNLPDILKKFKI